MLSRAVAEDGVSHGAGTVRDVSLVAEQPPGPDRKDELYGGSTDLGYGPRHAPPPRWGGERPLWTTSSPGPPAPRAEPALRPVARRARRWRWCLLIYWAPQFCVSGKGDMPGAWPVVSVCCMFVLLPPVVATWLVAVIPRVAARAP